VVIELTTAAGPRCLRLGSEFRVARSAALHAELDALLGDAIVGRVTANSHPPGADAVAAGSVA
jgi:hypothetical protein